MYLYNKKYKSIHTLRYQKNKRIISQLLYNKINSFNQNITKLTK